MRDLSRPRLLLLLPTTTYRAGAFVGAADRLEIDLTVASEVDSAFSSSEHANLLTLPFADPELAVQAAREFHQRHPVSAVFGIDDQTALLAARIAEGLELPHNSVAAVALAGNKYHQRVRLAEKGVAVPRFAVHDIDEDAATLAPTITYPAVLKPVDLSASQGVMRVDDAGDFAKAHRRLVRIMEEVGHGGPSGPSQFLIEDYVPGEEYAVEGVLEDGLLYPLAIFDKPDPLEGPFFAETIYLTPSRAQQSTLDALITSAQHACHALGLERGPVHIELRANDRGIWLIELAARPIGGRCGAVLRFGPGGRVSLEELLLGRALGRFESLPARERVAAGVLMIPVPRAGVFQEIRGVEAARRVPHIREIAVTSHRGALVRPLPEEARYLGFVFAAAPTPLATESAIRTAYDRLEVVVT